MTVRVSIVFGLLLASLWAACNVSYPDGTIACSSDADCPGRFTCRPGAGGGRTLLCFREAAQQSPAMGHEDGGGDRAEPPKAGTHAEPQAGASAQPSDSVVDQGPTGGDPEEPADGDDGGVREPPRDGGKGGTSACDPSADACEPGATRVVMEPCGPCNSGTQRSTLRCNSDCRWGDPEPLGECSDITAQCEPGDTKPEVQPCACGRTQTRTATCSDRCEWVPGTWTACDLAGVECAPGDEELETRSCQCGRSQSRGKVCSEACRWEVRGDWSECDLSGVQCQPGQTGSQTRMCAGCGTVPQQRSCAADTCNWGPWMDMGTCPVCEDPSRPPATSAREPERFGRVYVEFCDYLTSEHPAGTVCRTYSGESVDAAAVAECIADATDIVCGGVRQPAWLCNRSATDCRRL